MINHEYFELFNKNSVDKQLVISFDGGELTNTELHQQNFELIESICSDSELRFGRCEASEVKFRITNTLPLRNKEIEIKTYLDGDRSKMFSYGKYKVYSDTLTADKMFRDIIAYDKMREILNTNVADWYNSLTFPMSLNQFRNSFLTYFGVEWDVEDGGLMNDDIIIQKTIEPTELSGKTVIEGICELNGCFGRIGRNGKFQFIFLKQNIEGLYPSNTLYPKDDLFPKKVETIDVGKNTYINCTYQDFKTKAIDKLQIRKEENDVGVVVGEGDNTYIIQDNFLVYGKNESDLRNIANRILRNISKISYRPFNANSIGNPCFEPGDVIRLVTRYEMVESYILRRKLKGIQALKDNYSADGKEELSEKVNSVSNTIVQLKGKTNELERTIDETKSTINDVETGLESKITQTSSSLSLEIEDTKNGLQSQINQNATSISQKVSNSEFESYQEQTASSINQKVSKGSVVSEINQSAEQIKIKANKISLEGFTSINGNFSVDEYGNMHCKNAQVDGDVNAKSFVCQDTILIKDSVSGNTATVVKVNGNKVYIDPNGVATSAIINTPLVCQKNVQVNEVSCNNADYLLLNGPYVRLDSDNASILLSNDETPAFRPQADYKGKINLGSSNQHWKQIYCDSGSISLSDMDKKEDIQDIAEKYEELFFKVKPSTFRLKNINGVEHDRVHIGAISQQVEEVMNEIGMDAEELSFFCKDKRVEVATNDKGEEVEKEVDGYDYGLRYQEWIMLNTHMLQKAYKKIEEQSKEMEEMKNVISFLFEKIERLGV